MKSFYKFIIFTICFLTGLFSLPDLLADDRCLSRTGHIMAHAYVENPVGIFEALQSDSNRGLTTLRIPEEKTVGISINNFYESYTSDSTVSLISLDNLINSYQFDNKPCTLTIIFPYQ
jgi:hypothetical protein